MNIMSSIQALETPQGVPDALRLRVQQFKDIVILFFIYSIYSITYMIHELGWN